jgi:beta-phosphoglucomutase
MAVKACIFDMDGVIVDTAKFHFKAWQRLAESLGIPFTEHQNEQLKGVSRVDSLEKILAWGNLELNSQKKLELMELKNKWYLDFVIEVTPQDMLPGTFDFLKACKDAGVKIALGSSSKNAILILEKLQIIHFFDSIVDGNKITLSKPNPEVFLRAARELELQPADCVVFEDAISGVEAAKAGGFRCVGIGDAQILSKADRVVESLAAIDLSEL